ncbi:hypothetical protein NEIELOOT_00905 [Neisseria elongata subsp. glycolytica ATCC 29315]|uniref:Cytochrome c domain-containing protein n=1 Tax=Neisseria elongata subsp. glycolytica ATCC 29315 TaxID=546263 RepID=D4DPB8_NEIEG|nr:hypothetical protein NEIELOOT_00905 [Neisseria elongata subsp. glycolytica ATCC 29315]
MNKLLIAAMMMAALTACSQEAKQETKEAAQAIASDVKNNTASAVDAAASSVQEAASKVADTAEKAASEVKEAVAPEAKPAEKTEAPAAKVDGKAVYEATCKACHSGTIPGTPGVGKKTSGNHVSNKVKKPCTNTRLKASKVCLPKAVTKV